MKERFRRLSHTIYESRYPIIFCPKYWHRILKDDKGEYSRQQVCQLCNQEEEVEVIELNIYNLIIFIWLLPSRPNIQYLFMGYLKGKMAPRLFQQYEQLGRRYWGRHMWGRGYCVSTIGLDEEKIRKYVQWQEKQEKEIEVAQRRLFE